MPGGGEAACAPCVPRVRWNGARHVVQAHAACYASKQSRRGAPADLQPLSYRDRRLRWLKACSIPEPAKSLGT